MLWFYLLLVLIVALIGSVYWLWKRRMDAQLRDASDFEWDIFHKNEPEFVTHLNREVFYKVFHRTHFPLYPAYWLMAMATFLLSLPVTFIALYFVLWAGVSVGLIPESIEVANQLFIDGESMRFITRVPREAAVYYADNLGGFYYFFGIIAVWLAIVTLFLRHYHKNRPGYLRDEIIRAR